MYAGGIITFVFCRTTQTVDFVHTPGLTLYSSVSVSLVVKAVTWRLLTVCTSSDKAVSSWKWVANKQKALILVAINLNV